MIKTLNNVTTIGDCFLFGCTNLDDKTKKQIKENKE
jgi:hypothetical protein